MVDIIRWLARCDATNPRTPTGRVTLGLSSRRMRRLLDFDDLPEVLQAFVEKCVPSETVTVRCRNGAHYHLLSSDRIIEENTQAVPSVYTFPLGFLTFATDHTGHIYCVCFEDFAVYALDPTTILDDGVLARARGRDQRLPLVAKNVKKAAAARFDGLQEFFESLYAGAYEAVCEDLWREGQDESEDYDFVRFCLGMDPDLYERNKAGRTRVEEAERRGKAHTAALLKEYMILGEETPYV